MGPGAEGEGRDGGGVGYLIHHHRYGDFLPAQPWMILLEKERQLCKLPDPENEPAGADVRAGQMVKKAGLTGKKTEVRSEKNQFFCKTLCHYYSLT